MIRFVVPPFLIGAALIVGLVALWPTRRLYVAGRSAGLITAYFAGLWLLGILIAVAPRLARLTLPLLVVLYVVPFIDWRAGIDRLVGRRPREVRPPIKNVTPPDEATEGR
jgi:hypothetical protein